MKIPEEIQVKGKVVIKAKRGKQFLVATRNFLVEARNYLEFRAT